MTPAAIRVESLQVRHSEKTILEVPHLSVRKGEILAVIGPNGAGKSTFLQVLALLQKPSEGRIFFDGEEITNGSNLVLLRRRLALVFQEPLLLRGSVYDNASLGLRLRGMPRSRIKQRVEEWLTKLDIAHLTSRPVSKLSGGEAQRVSLARALALDPELLLLDEPFASLDPPTQASLIEDLQNILLETRITTVFVTHNRTEALMLGERVAVMIDGRIAQIDTPEKVFSHPTSKAVAAFVGVETIIEGQVLSATNGASTVSLSDHQIQVAGAYEPGRRLLVCLRPEDITLFRQRADVNGLGDQTNVICGKVIKLTPLEAQFKVIVDCGFQIAAVVSKQAFIDLALSKGKEIRLAFAMRAAHVIPAQESAGGGDREAMLI